MMERPLKDRIRSVIQALQGNFDHIMGQLRHLAEAHNALDREVGELFKGIDEGTISGAAGPAGAAGAPGAPGAAGADGARGQDGVPGFPGEDATEAVVWPGSRGPAGAAGAAGSPGATGPAGRPIPGWDGEDGLTFPIPGPRGPTGATGASGAPGPKPVVAPFIMEAEDGTFGPPGRRGTNGTGGGGAAVFRVVSADTISTGDQYPPLYFTASDTGTVTWAAISGDSSAASITATFKVGGTDMWAASTKPQVPGGGGVSAERTPDGGSFHLAAGDSLTLNLTGGTDGPVIVYVGFTPD